MIPRTFENPLKPCHITGHTGDGDPIDVVDISSFGAALEIGSVVPARILGSFCLIDNGEADWKVLVSRNETDTITQALINDIFGFFQNYKPESGNYIHADNKVFSAKDSVEILQAASQYYTDLIEDSIQGPRNRPNSSSTTLNQYWVPLLHNTP